MMLFALMTVILSYESQSVWSTLPLVTTEFPMVQLRIMVRRYMSVASAPHTLTRARFRFDVRNRRSYRYKHSSLGNLRDDTDECVEAEARMPVL